MIFKMEKNKKIIKIIWWYLNRYYLMIFIWCYCLVPSCHAVLCAHFALIHLTINVKTFMLYHIFICVQTVLLHWIPICNNITHFHTFTGIGQSAIIPLLVGLLSHFMHSDFLNYAKCASLVHCILSYHCYVAFHHSVTLLQ